jgi:K+-transporting ATPase ATPase C chain
MYAVLRSALLLVVALTVVTGLAYPALVTVLAQVLFPRRAAGSFVECEGRIVGSELIGQNFTSPGYFHGRPSAAGDGYDGRTSGGSNLGPNEHRLVARIDTVARVLARENPGTPIPVDLVTASGSGLDPHITPAAAMFQISRVAHQRGLSQNRLRRLVKDHIEGRQLGFLGEPRINVLLLNLALDELTTN